MKPLFNDFDLCWSQSLISGLLTVLFVCLVLGNSWDECKLFLSIFSTDLFLMKPIEDEQKV